MSFKKILAKIFLIIIIGASVAFPAVSFAAANGSYKTPSLWPTGFWGPIVWCTGDYLTGSANNQISGPNGQPATCTNLCDLVGTFVNVIYLALSIAIFVIAPLSFVIGGIMILVSGANPEMLGRGKKLLTGTVVGLAIVLCSYLIVNTALGVFNITAIGGFGGNASACSISS